MLSAVGLLITLFLGLVGWRIQLIGKRRPELAEEALLAFAQAIDALANVRGPMHWLHELEAVRKERDQDPAKRIPGEEGLVVFRRYREEQEKFSVLRRLHLLCRYHFGEAAGRAFEDLEKAVIEVRGAAYGLAKTQPDELASPEVREMQQSWRNAIWAGYARPDAVAEKVQAAQRDLEAMLTPHLRADAALVPIAVGWRSGMARAAALIRGVRILPPRKSLD